MPLYYQRELCDHVRMTMSTQSFLIHEYLQHESISMLLNDSMLQNDLSKSERSSDDLPSMEHERAPRVKSQRRQGPPRTPKDLITPYRIYMQKRRYTFYTPRMVRDT